MCAIAKCCAANEHVLTREVGSPGVMQAPCQGLPHFTAPKSRPDFCVSGCDTSHALPDANVVHES